MAIKLGDFFSSGNPVNEPGLELTSDKWKALEGGYRNAIYDASAALIKLEQTDDINIVNEIYQELWDELHHQGDVGLASYYSVPHLVRIAKEKNLVDYNVLGMVCLIEIRRETNNPDLPQKLVPIYLSAIRDLGELAKIALSQNLNLSLACSALAAIALAKGQNKLAAAIFNLDDESIIEEFLEKF